MEIKIQNYSRIFKIIDQAFKRTKVPKHIRTKVNEVLARPLLDYGSEAWPIRKQDEWRLTSAEMKFFRNTAGYSPSDHKNLMTEDLKITPTSE